MTLAVARAIPEAMHIASQRLVLMALFMFMLLIICLHSIAKAGAMTWFKTCTPVCVVRTSCISAGSTRSGSYSQGANSPKTQAMPQEIRSEGCSFVGCWICKIAVIQDPSGCLWNKHSLCASPCPAVKQQKLLSSFWFCVFEAKFPQDILLRRSVFFTDTGISQVWQSRSLHPSACPCSASTPAEQGPIVGTVSSHYFDSQTIKLRISNPRTIAYVHFNMPVYSSNRPGAGPILPDWTFENWP